MPTVLKSVYAKFLVVSVFELTTFTATGSGATHTDIGIVNVSAVTPLNTSVETDISTSIRPTV